MRARWTGPDRYIPDLARSVSRGDIVDGVSARDVKQGEYWEPAGRPARKPKVKKAAASPKTKGVADAD